MAFGTDAPVEPIDPWPGLALAVTPRDPRWPEGTPPFGPAEALTLDRALRAACVDAARLGGRGRSRAGSSAASAPMSSSSRRPRSTTRSSPAAPLDRAPALS